MPTNLVTTPIQDIFTASMLTGDSTVTSTLANIQQQDFIDGGDGNDTLVLTGGTINENFTITLSNTTNQFSSASTPGTVIRGFENLDFSGFLGKLTIMGTDISQSLIGGSGNDHICGLGGDDLLMGGDGNDNLNGNSGNDTMMGGAGDEFYHVDSLGDVIIELANQGNDIVYSTIDYTLGDNVEHLVLEETAIAGTGNALNNKLTGNSSNNLLTGGAGVDILDGSAGNDTMIGGTGNDFYYVDGVNDVVTELANEGIDTVYSTVGYTLSANVENLTLQGNALNNSGTGNALDNDIFGNAGDNLLIGLAGNDFLLGNAGHDLLNGGAGRDNLRGGTGRDSFVYFNLSDSLLATYDIIEDLDAAEDRFFVTTAPTQFTANAGNITALNATAISAVLTASVFANTGDAALFTFGSRQFVGINDSNMGFQSAMDAIIEVTGLTGTLSTANFLVV